MLTGGCRARSAALKSGDIAAMTPSRPTASSNALNSPGHLCWWAISDSGGDSGGGSGSGETPAARPEASILAGAGSARTGGPSPRSAAFSATVAAASEFVAAERGAFGGTITCLGGGSGCVEFGRVGLGWLRLGWLRLGRRLAAARDGREHHLLRDRFAGLDALRDLLARALSLRCRDQAEDAGWQSQLHKIVESIILAEFIEVDDRPSGLTIRTRT